MSKHESGSRNRQPLLDIRDLALHFELDTGIVEALRGINLSIFPGEIHGLVGESGSGKSVTARAIMRLNPEPPAVISRGTVLFEGNDLLKKNMASIRRIRGKKIGMIFQEPTSFLNPVMHTGLQIAEQLMYHERMTKRQALMKARDVLKEVELGTDDRVLNSFPHELSGGMKQRAMIAIAIACRPPLLLADEPTTALDVTIQKQIISLLKKLREELSISILFVSHDLWVVQEIADTVSVIYAGEIVERGTREEIFHDPRHPYTQGLVDSIPSLSHRGQRLKTIRGSVHSPLAVPSGCPFHPRCSLVQSICRERQSDIKRFSETHWCLCHMAAGNGTRRPQSTPGARVSVLSHNHDEKEVR